MPRTTTAAVVQIAQHKPYAPPLAHKVHITAPYLEGKGSFTPVMHELKGVDDARQQDVPGEDLEEPAHNEADSQYDDMEHRAVFG